MQTEFIDLISQFKRGSPFSETDAIMDILAMADGNGEFYSTIRQLMDRWKWGNKKTFTFIKKLEERNILETQKKHKGNTLYRINIGFIDIQGNTKETQRKHKGNTKQEEKPQEDTEIYKRIIEYMNMVFGTNYKYTTKATKEYIHARLTDGYTEDDFKTVIDKKFAEWNGTEWEKYLRPQTLFTPSNFESYLNQKVVKEKKQGEIDILDEWRNS